MTLAMRFGQLIRDGVVEDQGEIARLGHVTPARLSQIMGLLMLAPDIQEAILMLPCVHEGRDTVTKRDLRRITRSLDWVVQRANWSKLDQSRMVPKTDCQWIWMKISFMISS